MSGGQPIGWGRRLALAPVVLGALAVSIGGQVAAVEPVLGVWLAIVLAVTNDIGAVIALNEAMSATRREVKVWAWLAILLAAGTGGALNTWHTLNAKPAASPTAPPVGPMPAAVSEPLPAFFGWLVGLEPVLLVLVLTHLAALVMSEKRGGGRADERTVGDEVADRQRTTRQQTPGGTANANRQRTASPRPPAQPPAQPPARPPAPPARAGQAASGTASNTASPSPALPAGGRQDALRMTTGDTAGGSLTITGAAGTPPETHKATAEVAGEAAAPTPRQDWMTDLLIHQVGKKIAGAAALKKPYGRDQVVEDFGLTSYKARVLLAYIAERDLAREEAS